MEKNNKECTDQVLKELDGVYGLEKCKENVKNYIAYIKMKKNGDVNFGNYNIYISNNSEFDSADKLINIICKILKNYNIISTSYRYLNKEDLRKSRRENEYKKIKEMPEQLLIIDNETIDLYIDDLKIMVKDVIESFPDKIFIVMEKNRFRPLISENIGNCITWSMEIERISRDDKEDYIKKFLKKNEIKIEKKCTFVEAFSEEPFWKIKSEIVNIVLECKQKEIKIIDDKIIQEQLKSNYYKKADAIMKKNTDGLQALNTMVGMKEVKEQVERILSFICVNRKRKNMPSLHMCFYGNPGTGKTSVARIIGKIFEDEHILSAKGRFVEAHGRDLVGKYVGWTAQETKDLISRAEGGVLFIDEAYSLNSDRRGSFEDEAIATLIKEMEDKRDKLCIILAGYEKEMKELIQRNPGFESRIQFNIYFPDYTAEELYKIFRVTAKLEKYEVSNNVKDILLKYFEVERLKPNFSNGRFVRNLFEKIKFEQAYRVNKLKEENINTIKKCDIQKAIEKAISDEKIHSNECSKRKIGFAS